MMNSAFKFVSKRSMGSIVLIACILSMLNMALADFCPEDVRMKCQNVASILNIALSLVVGGKFFGVFD